MAKIGRNQPCVCGSGKKAKRCCGVRRGPSDEDLARAFLAAQDRQALPVVAGCDRGQLEELVNEMLLLPACDVSLLAPLPPILTPELDQLARATAANDGDIESRVDAVLPAFDTLTVRAHIARAVISLRDAGQIDVKVAALAVMNLAGRSTALLESALVQAVSIAAGAVETPSGLIVARR